ncbi:DUF2281 domain-containing protein [Fibrella sp. HMF5335]|uniref:DUF2281 domain-containing protein n=1 Tax=Fibrella rubiginis TaxID=2817060 RepID=A0A939GGW4_9BACT|nr:DUF2281 domain-containing protein [Fibrella rubiginis]MBO0938116.1 DUF2281 domain-containing protein [Fibrella rubiginis]
MLIAIEGTYENGHITLAEQPPLHKKTKVFVTFFEEEKEEKVKRQAGSLKGQIHVPDDFNEPLNDLRDYM